MSSCNLVKNFFFDLVIVAVVCFGDEEINQKGLLDVFIKKALEELRPNLRNIYIEHNDFETGPQEFGIMDGYIKNTTIKGLDSFNIAILKTSLISIKNLTIVVERFTSEGSYNVDGSLIFPLGKKDIHFFGNGDFAVKFENFTFSMSLTFKQENGVNSVDDLNVIINLDGMHMKLTNLMGGGELEKVFNDIINDVGLTVMNYYKQPLLDAVKPEIVKAINQILQQKTDSM